jgi:hypothetical protein
MVLGIPTERQINPVTKRLAEVMRALGWTKPPHAIRVGSLTCQGYTKTIDEPKAIAAPNVVAINKPVAPKRTLVNTNIIRRLI